MIRKIIGTFLNNEIKSPPAPHRVSDIRLYRATFVLRVERVFHFLSRYGRPLIFRCDQNRILGQEEKWAKMTRAFRENTCVRAVRFFSRCSPPHAIVVRSYRSL